MDGSRQDRWSRHAGVRWNPLALVIPAKAGIQGGKGGTNHTKHSRHASRFSTLVPAPAGMAIRTKACPRLRSGKNPFPSRPLVSSCRRPLESPRTRHSGESLPRTPIRGEGEKITSYTVWKHIPRLHNHTLGRGGDAGHPTDAGCSRRRRQQPEGPVQPQPAVSTPDDGSDRQQQ